MNYAVRGVYTADGIKSPEQLPLRFVYRTGVCIHLITMKGNNSVYKTGHIQHVLHLSLYASTALIKSFKRFWLHLVKCNELPYTNNRNRKKQI